MLSHLLLTFCLGNALAVPTWQATVQDLVPRDQIILAVSLNGVSTNLARAVGPALGGLLVASFGSGPVFLLNAASFTAMLVALARWQRPARESVMPSERMIGAIRAGIRYLRFAPAAQGVFVRTGLFVLGASALWALLPIVARYELGLDAPGYGVMLGSIGVGAITGVPLLPRVRARLSTDRVVALGTLLFAAATTVLATVRSLPLLCVALFAAGIAWIAVMPAFNAATQRAAPDWVRARMLAVYVLMFQGGLAVGSATWGAVASRVGVRATLLAAGAALAVGLLAARRFSLSRTDTLDMSPSGHWREPVVTGVLDQDDGPVLVTVEYRIAPDDFDAFTEAMHQVGRLRRRDGALTWGLYRDTADPWRVVETFVSESWGEHLRQHARATMADREVGAAARRFHAGDGLPVVAHFIHADARRAGVDRAAARRLAEDGQLS